MTSIGSFDSMAVIPQIQVLGLLPIYGFCLTLYLAFTGKLPNRKTLDGVSAFTGQCLNTSHFSIAQFIQLASI
jgi:hypothetical protein